MAKTDNTLDRLDLRPVFRSASKPAWINDRQINGFDTETADGMPFILSYCFGIREPEALSNDGEILSTHEILEGLCHREARGALNVWYNLDFDANVILSGLPIENLFEIQVFNETKFQDYVLTYIPAKLLSIRRHKHRYDHYDVSQFFFGGLDKAATEWLGTGKEKGDLDVTRFGDRDYRTKRFSDILHYAKIDAKRTRDLFTVFAREAESLGVPCGRPYSTGYLGEQAMNVVFQKPRHKPGFAFTGMQQMAWASYRGGRFEVIERGSVGRAVTVDINSAYPDALRKLPDPATLRWYRCEPKELSELSDADYGYVEATLTTDPARPLQPCAIRQNGKLEFPALRNVRVTMLKQDLLYAVSTGIVREYEMHSAYLALADRFTEYPFDFLNELYRKRQELKAEGRDKAQQVVKIIINSIYGKLCQLTEQSKPCDDAESPDFFPIDALPYALRQWAEKQCIQIKRKVKCGSYFNPFLASHITGLTRLKLVQTAIDNGFENDTLMLATDSLMVREEVFNASPFAATTSKEFGEWESEGAGDAFIVGSGIYEIAQEDGKVKSRTRGFEKGFGMFMLDLSKEGGIRTVAGSHLKDPRIIPITSRRPLKIPQAIHQNWKMEEVGKFFEFPRGIRAGMDSKRVWPRGENVTWRELLDAPERSTPKVLAR